MLAEPKDVEADLVRKLRLLDQPSNTLLGADVIARLGVLTEVSEGVDAEFHPSFERSSGPPCTGRATLTARRGFAAQRPAGSDRPPAAATPENHPCSRSRTKKRRTSASPLHP